MDQWSFDVFLLQEASGDHALKFLVHDLLIRYDLINHFRVSPPVSMATAYTVTQNTNKKENERKQLCSTVSQLARLNQTLQ